MTRNVNFTNLSTVINPDLQTVVYIAEGKSYTEMAIISAESLRAHNSNMQVVLFTSDRIASDAIDFQVAFSSVFEPQGMPRVLALKPKILSRLNIGPFLYMDADTYVCGNMKPLWLGLESHAFLMVQDTWRYPEIYHDLHPGFEFSPGHPSIPYYNGGLLLARGDDETRDFCRDWGKLIIDDARFVRDQLALRMLIEKRRPNFGTLPQEYNARTCDPLQLSGRVYMIHEATGELKSRRDDLRALGGEINKSIKNRLWDPALRKISHVQVFSVD